MCSMPFLRAIASGSTGAEAMTVSFMKMVFQRIPAEGICSTACMEFPAL